MILQKRKNTKARTLRLTFIEMVVFVMACSAGGCRRGRVDIPSRVVQAAILNQVTVESWGEVKSLPSQWEGERKIAFSLQFSQSATNPKWRLNTRKMKTTKTRTKTACTAGYVRNDNFLVKNKTNEELEKEVEQWHSHCLWPGHKVVCFETGRVSF